MPHTTTPTKKTTRTALPPLKTKVENVPKEVAEGAHPDIRSEDVSFLIDCLQHTVGGHVLIDCNKVAKKRNLTNHRSVSNRLSTLKKKYGLPLASGGAMTPGGGKNDDDNDGGMGVQTSEGNRISKKSNRDQKGPKGGARKSPKKPFKQEEILLQSASVNGMDVERESAVDTDELERMVFGEPDEEDDSHQEYLAVGTGNELDVI